MKQLIYVMMLFFCFKGIVSAQNFTDTWTQQQLMDTKTLADKIVRKKMKNTVVVNIGPDAVIKNSFHVGPGADSKNIDKMKAYLQNIAKDKEVVLYCGCCPFTKCPNIRPAFKALTELGYKNAKLLNIPKNIKVDWIDKKYPVN